MLDMVLNPLEHSKQARGKAEFHKNYGYADPCCSFLSVGEGAAEHYKTLIGLNPSCTTNEAYPSPHIFFWTCLSYHIVAGKVVPFVHKPPCCWHRSLYLWVSLGGRF